MAITFDLHGLQCWTAVVATTDIEVSLKAVEQSLEFSEADRTSAATHIRLRKVLPARWQDVEPGGKMAYVMLGIWLGVNNPADAVGVRAAISRSIRQHGRSHLTLTSDARQNWGFAVAERPVEISRLLALIPDGLVLDFVWKAPTEKEQPLN